MLVAAEMVLTAAHCMNVFAYALEEQSDLYPLQIGAHCQERDNCGQHFELIYVEEMFVHPEFDMYTGLPEHDLALLKLKTASTIKPVEMDIDGVSFEYENGESWNQMFLVHNKLSKLIPSFYLIRTKIMDCR